MSLVHPVLSDAFLGDKNFLPWGRSARTPLHNLVMSLRGWGATPSYLNHLPGDYCRLWVVWNLDRPLEKGQKINPIGQLVLYWRLKLES